MSKWRDRLSDAADSAWHNRLSWDDPKLYAWEYYTHSPWYFEKDNLVRARVYDSLSCDGLGVDELDDDPVMSERRER